MLCESDDSVFVGVEIEDSESDADTFTPAAGGPGEAPDGGGQPRVRMRHKIKSGTMPSIPETGRNEGQDFIEIPYMTDNPNGYVQTDWPDPHGADAASDPAQPLLRVPSTAIPLSSSGMTPANSELFGFVTPPLPAAARSARASTAIAPDAQTNRGSRVPIVANQAAWEAARPKDGYRFHQQDICLGLDPARKRQSAPPDAPLAGMAGERRASDVSVSSNAPSKS
jgi:hypothetical protein